MSVEQENLYINPLNTDDIIEELKNSQTHNEIMDIIHKTFPGWIIGYPKKYCLDYPHLQSNWEFVCKKSGTKPLNIIIVDKIEFNDPQYSLVKTFCELLTVFGHSVRRKEEFIGCKYCGDAIPTQSIYNQLRERQINVPDFWSLKCTGC